MFRRRKKEIPSLFSGESDGKVKLEIERSSSLDHQVKMIGLTKNDLSILNALQPFVEKNIHAIVDKFYLNLEEEPSLIQLINDNSSMERLKQTLRRHLLEMFSGKIDKAYVQQRHKIAFVHVKIGLESKWYLAGFQDLLSSFIALVNENVPDREEAFKAIQAVTKIINLEEQLVLETYENEIERIRIESQNLKAKIQEDVIQTSETLAAISQETHASFEELVAQSDSVTLLANTGSELSQSASKQATLGKEEMNKLAGKMEEMVASINEVRVDAERLDRIMKEMQDVITIVSGVAEQTNLLSLNASIEAARAGESGRGFAVVAEEVRKLSDQTKESVVKVTNLINNTNEKVNQLTETLTLIGKEIQSGNDSSKTTEVQFGEIVEKMADTNKQNDRIAEEIRGFVESIHQLGESFEEVAASADILNGLTNKIDNIHTKA